METAAREKIMELQQSPRYAAYVKLLGWRVETLEGVHIYMRSIPLSGVLAKIQRPTTLPSLAMLIPLLQKHRVKQIAIDFSPTNSIETIAPWIAEMKKSFTVQTSNFLPTKTTIVDLTPAEQKIFDAFSEAKRRAVRRAIKYGITVKETDDIKALIRVKNKSAGFLGFITTHGLKELWDLYHPKHATILLAYASDHSSPVGGIFLLFHEKTAYYWIAGATKHGKKYFAPTLLSWEAMKLSKQKGYTKFDFVGVWDERLPQQNTSWKGFTKFKEEFGGTPTYYPVLAH